MNQSAGNAITFEMLLPQEWELVGNGFCWDYLYPGGFLRIYVGVANSVCKVHRKGAPKPYVIHDWLKRDRGIAPEYVDNLIYSKGKWHDYDQAAANWREILRRAADLSPVLFGEPYPNPDPQDSPIFIQEITEHEGAMWARVQQ